MDFNLFNSLAVVDSQIKLFTDTALTLSQSTNDTVAFSSTSVYSSDTIQSFSSEPVKQAFYNHAVVDKSPEFPGGMEKFYRFLRKNIHYTHQAKKAGLSAKMYIRFIVDEEGLISSVEIMNKVGYGLDEEVQNVLRKSPRWSPGNVRNEAVKTEMILPVVFSLQ